MRGRGRPGKPASVMGLLVGAVFIVIGVTDAIPRAGAFGVFWTLVAAGITAHHVYNLLRLRQDGLLTEAEYQEKRAESLNQRW